MELTVYTTPWCSDCREAKRFLDKHKIAYKEIDIENDPAAAAEVVKHAGRRSIPQFVIDGKWVQPYTTEKGFLYEEMEQLLGVTKKQ